VKYWIDTDPGVDDAIAIILASKSLGDDLTGLSSVQGNFVEPVSAHNLYRIIEEIKRSNILPKEWKPLIARGSNVSLMGPPYRSADYRGSFYHGEDGLACVKWSAPANGSDMAAVAAAQEIYDRSRLSKNYTLVCLGPLTNIATSILLNPDLPEFVTRLVIMGGSLRVGGNETMAAEFNFAADPEAAQLVLNSGFREIKMVPLDPCYDVRFTTNEFKRLKKLKSPTSRLIDELVKGWKERTISDVGVGLYDAVAWVLSQFPKLARWESVYVTVDTSDGISRGASIADWQKRSGNQPNVMAATSIPDRDAFYDKYFDLIAN
jgi:inosine-uridine nucleoside N-ribohydrolase